MKTVVLIPYEAAPLDPEWLLKYHRGEKLNPKE
jgi:hypothetical protein